MRAPNLYLAGPPRTGTTSMARLLGEHPAIDGGSVKEPGFHCADLLYPGRIDDRRSYLSLYGSGEPRYLLDGTPWYLYSVTAAESIHRMSPGARFVVSLRNPVDLITSLHGHHRFMGLEPEPDEVKAVFDPRRRGDSSDFRTHLDYLGVARIGAQVLRLLEFFPPSQVHFVPFEQLVADSRAFHLGLLNDLGLEPLAADVYARFNSGRRLRSRRIAAVTRRLRGAPDVSRLSKAIATRVDGLNSVRNVPALSRHDRRRIMMELVDDVEVLEKLSGRDLGHWLQDAEAD